MNPRIMHDVDEGMSPTAAAIAELLDAERRLDRARECVGRTVYDRRTELGLTGAALARIAKVSASELSKLERALLARGETIARKVDTALTLIERERFARLTASKAS